MSRLFGRIRSWLTLAEGPSLASVGGYFVALDVETTGLDPRRDAIVSLAAIPFVAGVPTEGCVTLVDPGRVIPRESTAIHGLTDDMVRGAPVVDDAVRAADLVIGSSVLVGHNIGFDVAIMARARRARGLPRLGNHALDTGRLAAALHPRWRDFGLESLADRLGVQVVARHTAEGDALTAGRIFVALVPELQTQGVRTVSELLRLQRYAPGR